MKKLLFICVLFVFLFSCNNNKIKQVVLKKELSSKQCDFSFTELFKVANNKLYTSSYVQGLIFEYDLNLNLIKTIGKKGAGPQEFKNPISMAILPNNKLLVNDIFNIRFAYINQKGIIDSTKKYRLAFLLENDAINKNVYIQRYPMLDDTTILKYSDDGEYKKMCDIPKLMKEHKLTKGIYRFAAFDENFIIVFADDKKMFFQDKNKNIKPFNLSYLPKSKHEHQVFGLPRYYKNNIIIPYADFSVDKNISEEDALKMYSNATIDLYFIKCDLNGKVNTIYNIDKQDDCYLSYNAWDIKDNKIYIFDLNNEKLVRYNFD